MKTDWNLACARDHQTIVDLKLSLEQVMIELSQCHQKIELHSNELMQLNENSNIVS